MSKKVVAVGDNCVDIYYTLNQFYPTGNAVDFAINLSQLGCEIALVSIKGNDIFGKSIENVLNKSGIDLSHFHKGDKQSAMAQMNLINGDRVHEQFFGNVLADFKLTEDDIEFIKKFDIVYSERWARIGRYIKDIKLQNQIWIHDFSKRLDETVNEGVLPYLDYAFYSYPQKDSYIEEFIKTKQQKTNNGVVIAMLGEDGSLAYDGSKYIHQKANKCNVVNTVGAGDSYIAGFTKGLSEEKGLPECMKMGTEVATKIIQIFNPYQLQTCN
ncbi:fructoselysine 6-kinase [Clostridium beijerinckii]|uniref:Carbohydrate kinase PfkB domain-containing protein n=1 Tax=Clostridium beijerinckii TaxID=1520 RepID=A0A1S9NB62_CLOBE|nr:fructoselysine 6-kinase [Clostridium beijerinckii]OOP74688.1 hypothetical protein CBEIBR21_00540 [Clostridium beijerinckii]